MHVAGFKCPHAQGFITSKMSEAKHKIEPVSEVKEGHIGDDFPEFKPVDTATCLKRRDRFKHALSECDNSMQVIEADICKSVRDDERC